MEMVVSSLIYLVNNTQKEATSQIKLVAPLFLLPQCCKQGFIWLLNTQKSTDYLTYLKYLVRKGYRTKVSFLQNTPSERVEIDSKMVMIRNAESKQNDFLFYQNTAFFLKSTVTLVFIHSIS